MGLLALVGKVPGNQAFRIAVIALTIATAAGGEPVTKRQAGELLHTIERRYNAGDADRYNVEFQATVNNPDFGGAVTIKVLITMLETTKSVKPDGGAVLTDECETALMKFGDSEIDVKQLIPAATQTRNKFGVVAESKTGVGARTSDLDGIEPIRIFSNVQRFFYTGKAVKVGDAWPISGSETGRDGSKIATSGNATRLGVEKVGAFNTFRIKTVAEVVVTGATKSAPPETRSRFEGVGNVDRSTGKLVRMVGTMDTRFGPLGRNRMSIDIELTPDTRKSLVNPGALHAE